MSPAVHLIPSHSNYISKERPLLFYRAISVVRSIPRDLMHDNSTTGRGEARRGMARQAIHNLICLLLPTRGFFSFPHGHGPFVSCFLFFISSETRQGKNSFTSKFTLSSTFPPRVYPSIYTCYVVLAAHQSRKSIHYLTLGFRTDFGWTTTVAVL